MRSVTAAIIGSRNVGARLLLNFVQGPRLLVLVEMIGRDPNPGALARPVRTRRTNRWSLRAYRRLPVSCAVKIPFGATSANAHTCHSEPVNPRGARGLELTFVLRACCGEDT